MFAWIGSPLIRGYNRISVFIGLLSIAALILALDVAARWFESRSGAPMAVVVLLAINIGLFGLWDQTRPVDQSNFAATFGSDREFFREMERKLPPQISVYQLPYHPYPETGPLNRMADYDLLRGFLHTDDVRWSYGAMKGREGDLWLRALYARPMEEQLDLAARSGFGAVYLDRRGYRDGGAEVEPVLRRLLGEPIAADAPWHLMVYRLPPECAAPNAGLSHSLSEGIDFAVLAFPFHSGDAGSPMRKSPAAGPMALSRNYVSRRRFRCNSGFNSKSSRLRTKPQLACQR